MTNKCIISQKPIKNLTDANRKRTNLECVIHSHIGSHIHKRKWIELYSLIDAFEMILNGAMCYKHATGKYNPHILGDLGEIFVEIILGMKRHKQEGIEGSDGLVGRELVEVKTITPERKDGNIYVHVKRTGNFRKLVAVKISKDFEFEARILDREKMPVGAGGQMARVSWNEMNPIEPNPNFFHIYRIESD